MIRNETPKYIKALFPDFEFEHFPTELCNVPNLREAGVLDSGATFLCVMATPGHTTLSILPLHPYVAADLDGTPGAHWGWTDGMNWYDHKDRSVHRDDTRVVAWRRLPDDKADNPFDLVDWVDPDPDL